MNKQIVHFLEPHIGIAAAGCARLFVARDLDPNDFFA
jgi:hypothetical protein